MVERLIPTPSQTVGPFFSFGLLEPPQPEVVPEGTPGAVLIEGTVFDGQGQAVPDAMIEIWQAGPSGRYPHPDDPRADLPLEEDFAGFGRCGTDDTGRFWFRTIKPGAVPWLDGRPQAPHLDISVFARGLLHRLVTRLYFPDEAEANAADPLLSSLSEASRPSLIAFPEDGTLRFDIHLQGPGETTFFQI